jgi:lon-related putative ATP-dependent protease
MNQGKYTRMDMTTNDIKALGSAALYQPCALEQFAFQTTAELDDLTEIIGQARALDAVRLGAGMRRSGYNIFVLGSPGMGKHTFVRGHLEARARQEAPPSDWCYVNNFEQPHKPRVLRLPAGRGVTLRQDMTQLVEELRSAIPAAFDSEEYRRKVEEIKKAFNERQEQALSELGNEAMRRGVALLRTPGGFAFAPARNNEVIAPEEYDKLPDREKERVEKVVSAFQERLQGVIRRITQWRRERREKVKALDREVTMRAVGHLIDELREKYTQLPALQEYLSAVEQDVIENVDDFRRTEESPVTLLGLAVAERPSLHRYQVNVLVDHSAAQGAPVVSEDNPGYNNLLGRIEHSAQFGTLVTEFTLIKPGSLHRANGGYLLLDIHKVLSHPFVWESLKRALYAREIRIESLGQMYSLISTVSLEPEPIPLEVKIILFGDRLFYYLLHEYDPEFSELFKVAADFEETLGRSPENHLLYARMIATLARKENLLPFARGAVARIIEHSARIVEDAEKLSTHMQRVADVMREADYWAREAGRENVAAEDVQRAIEAGRHRGGRLKAEVQEEILRGRLLIDTRGLAVGQVNGLSVVELGAHSFAQPMRITATTRLGEGEFINIEREVKLSGAIHSKGVLILSSFLAARYSKDRPLSLAASLVFEQSYGFVEGDSASLTELCALLSSLAEIPVRQSLAVTGSVNQFGQVQAIGAVNDKIEGFFDICKARGLTGDQGVLIPVANVKNLMLREDVVQAAAAGQFHIYPVENIDQAIEMLTGVAAGAPDKDGKLPPGTVNYLVAVKLYEFALIRQEFGEGAKGGKQKSGDDEEENEEE